MFDLKQFQKEVGEWNLKNFGPKAGKEHQPLLGVLEELGELAHAHLKAEQKIRVNEDHHAAKVDAVADLIVFLADYCNNQGIDLESAISETWEKVKQRDWTKNRVDGGRNE